VVTDGRQGRPSLIDEAALIDGASLWTRYFRITRPRCRPALAAVATLLRTWIYNDFFSAVILVSTGNTRPITSALANLQGQFVTDQNMIAAAALIAAVPTLIVYILLQKQFSCGLALGSSQGNAGGVSSFAGIKAPIPAGGRQPAPQ
jgi:multiple sugar transport system permease protein